MYLNKALIFGNLTRDPELRSLPSGKPVVNFGIATNRVWKDQDGNKQEAADFHNIVAFGRQAETIAQYLRRGSSALVEGRIQTRSWDADDGTKRYRTEIVADRVQFGPRSGGEANREQTSPTSASDKATTESDSAAADKSPSSEEQLETIEYPDEDIKAEDIPF